MLKEYPGMLSSGYAATGKLGLGFFSVFMWRDRVKVVTRGPLDAQHDTRILEFESGLSGRPLLRPANHSEIISHGGTCVRIWLHDFIGGPKGILNSFQSKHDRGIESFPLLCAKLACTFDVDLYVEQDDRNSEHLISGDDWTDMPGEELLARVWGQESHYIPKHRNSSLKAAAENLRLLYDKEGEPLVRVCLVPQQFPKGASHPGIMTIGGLYATFIHNFAGVLLAELVTAARNEGTIVADPESLASWASEQSTLIERLTSNKWMLFRCANILWQMGGDIRNLPVALTRDGWLTYDQVARIQDLPTEVVVAPLPEIRQSSHIKHTDLLEGVFLTLISGGVGLPSGMLCSREEFKVSSEPKHPAFRRTRYMVAALATALAEAWGVSPVEVLQSSTIGWSSKQEMPIASIEGREIKIGGCQIRKP